MLPLILLASFGLLPRRAFCQGNFDACASLICDPPKECIIQEEVAQCLVPSASLLPPLQWSTLSSLATVPPPTPTLTAPPFELPPALTPFPTLPTFPTFAPFSTFGPFSISTPPPLTPSTTPSLDICTLAPLTGHCSRFRIMWYYDAPTKTCQRFSFSGCGNPNRFPSRMQCELKCLTRN